MLVRILGSLGFLALVGVLAFAALKPAPSPEGGTGYTHPAEPESFVEPERRQAVEDVLFTDGDGKPVRLSDRRGQVLLVNFWATWCGPCVKEMPSLDRVQARLGGERFEVLALSQDRDGAPVVAKFMAELGLANLRVYLDKGGAAGRKLDVRGLPTTVLVDAEGREAARIEGADEWDAPELLGIIERVIAEGTEPERHRREGRDPGDGSARSGFDAGFPLSR